MQRSFRENLRITPLGLSALVIGVVIHLAGFVALSFESGSDRKVKIREAFVQYPNRREGEHSVLFKEQASLFDTAPLFLPTAWNHSFSLKEIRMQEEQTSLFDSFPAQITLDRSKWEAFSWFDEPRVDDHRGMLQSEFWDTFHYFGSSRRAEETEIGRGSWIEVISYGRATPIRIEPLPVQIREAGEGALWSPVDLRILVDRVGLIGEPFLVNSSGSDRVDETIEGYLWESAPSWGLRPGYYEIRVGP